MTSNRCDNPNFTGNAKLGTSVVESREAMEARILISETHLPTVTNLLQMTRAKALTTEASGSPEGL